MIIKDFINDFTRELASLGWYDSREIRTMASYLLKEIASVESYKIIVSPEEELDEGSGKKLLQITAMMATGCPLQYALGYEYFCGHKFKVKEGVLIPRPETEELVRLITKETPQAIGKAVMEPVKILDICTGSGCIAWSLAAALPQSRVWGCDISDVALEVASSQSVLPMETMQKISFFKCDILAEQAQTVISEECFAGTEESFDVIVSNPPYICKEEMEQMRPNVLDFEPGLALFVPDDDPLLFYRRIAELSGKMLKKGGRLYFEANERFAMQVAEYMESCGFNLCNVVKDMFGKDRMVCGVKKYCSNE